MKKEDFLALLKKCFGKEKEEKFHSIAMLTIYGVFLIFLILLIRIGGTTTQNLGTSETPNEPTPTVLPSTSPTPGEDSTNAITQKDNYSYTYTITYRGISEVFLGKRVGKKEKFTSVKDGVMLDYAFLDGTYYLLENNFYQPTENPNRFLKYCDYEKIMEFINQETPIEENGKSTYHLSNSKIGSVFLEQLSVDNEESNLLVVSKTDQVLRTVDFDLSNYYSSVQGSELSLQLHLEFVEVGMTEDFEIPIES